MSQTNTRFTRQYLKYSLFSSPFLPIEALLHKNLLNMFVNMIRNENSVEYEIAKRQLVMKDTPRECIFTHIQSILDRYDLP